MAALPDSQCLLLLPEQWGGRSLRSRPAIKRTGENGDSVLLAPNRTPACLLRPRGQVEHILYTGTGNERYCRLMRLMDGMLWAAMAGLLCAMASTLLFLVTITVE